MLYRLGENHMNSSATNGNYLLAAVLAGDALISFKPPRFIRRCLNHNSRFRWSTGLFCLCNNRTHQGKVPETTDPSTAS